MKMREQRSAEQLIKELKAIEEDEEYCDGEWVGDQEDEVFRRRNLGPYRREDIAPSPSLEISIIRYD
jgi:hypothetical protein